jgi:excisionase family DNA binding protein
MRSTAMQQDTLLNGNRRRVYTVGEVSEILQVSAKTVYRLVARGLLKKSDALRHLRISAESLEAFIKN